MSLDSEPASSLYVNPVVSVSGTSYVDLAKANPALVIIDMQRAFVDRGAPFEVDGAAEEVVPKVNRLIAVAREARIPLIWLQVDYTPPVGGLAVRKFPAILEDKSLWRGSPDFALHDGLLQPFDHEYRLVKHTYDAFYHTPLEWVLRNENVDTVIICGVSSDVCCDTTARSAYCRGFYAVLVGDASAASGGREFHNAVLQHANIYFARVMATDEVTSELGSRKAEE